MKDEIIIYDDNPLSTRIEVRVNEDTVWLNRKQLASLFDRDSKTIGKHISNCLQEELKGVSVVAKFATTASDGKIYQVEHYNLDMIISIGYRVKSSRGIQFRIWANKILKNYLLKGYSVNQRMNHLEKEVHTIRKKIETFDLQLHTKLPPNEGVFYNGQIFDAYLFITDVIKSAQKSIIIIDNYIDETVLTILDKRKENVQAIIFTAQVSKKLQLDLHKHNQQYPKIDIRTFSKSHDRFIIIDEDIVYHIGASLKDLGRKWFAFSNIKIDAKNLIRRIKD